MWFSCKKDRATEQVLVEAADIEAAVLENETAGAAVGASHNSDYESDFSDLEEMNFVKCQSEASKSEEIDMAWIKEMRIDRT